MSDHLNLSDADVADAQLSDADIDRALATSLARGSQLVHRRNRRMTVLGGLGAAVLLVGGFGVLNSLGDDGSIVVDPAQQGAATSTTAERSTSVVTALTAPAPSTTVAAPIEPAPTVAPTIPLAPAISTTKGSSVPTTSAASVPPLAPAGFVRRDRGGITTLVNENPTPEEVTPTTNADGASVGGGTTLVRAEEIRSFAVIDRFTLRVVFACTSPVANRIDSVLFQRAGKRVTVMGTISGGPTGVPCHDGVGPAIDLVFPTGDLTSDVEAVPGLIDG